jgi:hypothetical protein
MRDILIGVHLENFHKISLTVEILEMKLHLLLLSKNFMFNLFSIFHKIVENNKSL